MHYRDPEASFCFYVNIQEDTVFPIYEPLYTVYPETLTDPEKFWVRFSLDALLSRHSRFCYPLCLQAFSLLFHAPYLA